MGWYMGCGEGPGSVSVWETRESGALSHPSPFLPLAFAKRQAASH